MILLSVAGQVLRMTSFKERTDAVMGEAVRALDATLQDGTSAGKRAWEGESLPMIPAEMVTLRTNISAGPVVCEIRTEEVLCKVTIEGAPVGPDVSGNLADWTNFNDSPTLLLREV